MLSMTTDYAKDTGCPEPYLRRIAEAGFTHVHWCHQWCTDFVYDDCEIDQIARWLRQFGLGVTDVHASNGVEKRWTSALEYERQAGAALVRNRIQMAARLGGDVIIMHTGGEPEDSTARSAFWDALRRSLDELEPFARERGVRIAIENGQFDLIARLLDLYGADYLGLCYDSGHGNVQTGDIDRLERLKHRLISIHLHDNDGVKDLHMLPFTGTVDWPRIARIIAESSYAKWPSLESTMKHGSITDEAAFLAHAHHAASMLADMVEAARKGHHG